jgi:hypothetical protein
MKLVPYEKSPDIIGMMALKSSVLCLHQKAVVQPTKSLMATTSEYQCFGIQADSAVFVGVADFDISQKHGTAKCGLFLEQKDIRLKDAVVAIKEFAKNTGMAKISVSLLCGEDGIADTMREAGFLPEVRFRSHMYVGGSLFTTTEYGIVL